MTSNQITAIVLGILGLGVGGLSVYLHVNEKDGSGWGFLALCLIITSCNHA